MAQVEELIPETPTTASAQFERLKNLLMELFQLNQPDLDFGVYRVLHARAHEVGQFLEKDLLPQVRKAFELYRPADKAALEQELNKTIAQAEDLGVDPETLPKVIELRDHISSDAVDVSSLEREVYDDLFRFFRRYYSEGDFVAKRVYKPGTYAIPYEGEETKLHWANREQYYIKTNENLRDYTFRLRPDDIGNPLRVHFRLADATEGEHGNVKAAEGKDRVFIPSDEGFLSEADGELMLSFEYRPASLNDWPDHLREGKTKPPNQRDLISIATERTFSQSGDSYAAWINELEQPHVLASGEKADYTRLEAHLRRYAARNTFDYFIHKDLGEFLRQELDFYIKNEIMHLDDVENESAPKVEQYLSKIKIIRRIAGKIIHFLTQLEEFQKRLWLKKKFVVQTDYCITLDRVPEELFPEIAANEAQREEWVRLFAINELEGDAEGGGYTQLLSVDFLQANRGLVVDTSFFEGAFTERLIDGIEDLDDSLDGILVHGDNFQALQLLGERLREQVKCSYNDPPYNTDSSAIPYKNNYKHSSWITMMSDRLEVLHSTLTEDGAIFVSIDKTERTVLQHLMDDIFGAQNRVEELIWVMNTTNSQVPNYSTNHEYVLVYAKNRSVTEQDQGMFREPKPGYEEVMELMSELNPSFPAITGIEAELKALYDLRKSEYRQEVEAQGLEWKDEQKNDPWRGIYSYKRAEYRDEDGNLVPESEAKERGAKIWIWQEGDASMPAGKQAKTTQDPEHPNWRFYNPIHPATDKPCPHPKSGWKFAYEDNPDSPDKRSFAGLDRDGRIAWGTDETKVPRIKRMLHEVETNIGKSVFVDYSDGEKQTSAMFGRSGVFLAPKHSKYVSRFILHGGRPDSIIVDGFGGSGSTAQAVIDLNREDGGRRKFVIVEVGEYFDTVLKPRVLKAVYSRDWRGGKPLSREGVSQTIKLIRLESYEDTLNNLELQRSPEQQGLLDDPEAQHSDGFREGYVLRYMLDVETKGSQSLLNAEMFGDPGAYTLRVRKPGSDEGGDVVVDLLETFNWLLGLNVEHVSATRAYSADFERDGEGRLRVTSMSDADPRWWFRTVKGATPDGRSILVIWRNLTGEPEQDNAVLDEWFVGQGYSSKSGEFDVIYVNGDSNLDNLKTPDETWKVRTIEEDFRRMMFVAPGL